MRMVQVIKIKDQNNLQHFNNHSTMSKDISEIDDLTRGINDSVILQSDNL